MECPFELPAKREFTHVNEAGVKYKVVIEERAIASYLTKDEADYIVQVINSHKKLTEACSHSYNFMICVSNLDNEENLKWQEDITEELKQALEESEKPK